MLSSEIYYKVKSIHKHSIDMNGYKYIPVSIILPGKIESMAYVSRNRLIHLKEGKTYKAQKAYLTSNYGGVAFSEDFAFRIDYVEEVPKEEYNSQEETKVTFNAKLGKTSNNILKFLGPMKIPTFSVRATLKNEDSKPFNLLAVGYHSRAKLLNSLCNVCYVDIDGIISAPRKPGMTCAIVVQDIILRKEVEL